MFEFLFGFRLLYAVHVVVNVLSVLQLLSCVFCCLGSLGFLVSVHALCGAAQNKAFLATIPRDVKMGCGSPGTSKTTISSLGVDRDRHSPGKDPS